MANWLHNFICGAGTLLEIMPPVPSRHISVGRKIRARLDAEAFYSDWEKIGADFWTALGQVKSETNGNGTGPRQSSERKPITSNFTSPKP